jgi:uncharacterized protein involved in type VI secretion and phage assembly
LAISQNQRKIEEMAMEQISFDFEDKRTDKSETETSPTTKPKEGKLEWIERVAKEKEGEGYDPETARKIAELSFRSLEKERRDLEGSRRTEILEQKDPNLR